MIKKRKFVMNISLNELHEAMQKIDESIYQSSFNMDQLNDMISKNQKYFDLLLNHFECSPKALFLLILIYNMQMHDETADSVAELRQYLKAPVGFIRKFDNAFTELYQMRLLHLQRRNQLELSKFVETILTEQKKYSEIKAEIDAHYKNPVRLMQEINVYLDDKTNEDNDSLYAYQKLQAFMEHNSDVNFIHRLKEIKTDHYLEWLLLCKICYNYTRSRLDFDISRTVNRMVDDIKVHRVWENIINQKSILFELGYLEAKSDLVSDNTDVKITHKVYDDILKDDFSKAKDEELKHSLFEITKPNEIAIKELFYNEKEQKVIKQLYSIFSNARFVSSQAVLKENGLRGGIAVLLSGYPGTGKTELVNQLARWTGRHIFRVNISKIKDKWVGNSERNVKQIFDAYRSVAESNELAPILLLNEADALLGTRIQVDSSVDQMNNSMQNIFLQELEEFDGLCVATTNLDQNFDNAFMRRFLFRINLSKPDVKVRANIIHSKIRDISLEQAMKMAIQYDITGGQIDNILKRGMLHLLIYGKQAGFDDLMEYASEECTTRTKQVGFKKT